jgi:hypothetical protein
MLNILGEFARGIEYSIGYIGKGVIDVILTSDNYIIENCFTPLPIFMSHNGASPNHGNAHEPKKRGNRKSDDNNVSSIKNITSIMPIMLGTSRINEYCFKFDIKFVGQKMVNFSSSLRAMPSISDIINRGPLANGMKYNISQTIIYSSYSLKLL